MDSVIDIFRERAGYEPDLDNPKRFNEKVLWRKLNDRRPILTDLTDKFLAKNRVKDLGVDTIPHYLSDTFPFPVILKPNNYSGRTFLVKKLEQFIAKEESLLSVIQNPYGQQKGEWAYKNIEPRLLIEPVITDYREVKLFVFDGTVEVVNLIGKRPHMEGLRHAESYGTSYFWPDGEFIDVRNTRHPLAETEWPDLDLDRLIGVAEKLSLGLDFVRVDLMVTYDAIYFGEYTFYPGSGHIQYQPESFDRTLGDFWELPKTVAA